MDRINDKHIQEKGHRADCRKKQQGTRIKAALLAGLAGAVLANTFPWTDKKSGSTAQRTGGSICMVGNHLPEILLC